MCYPMGVFWARTRPSFICTHDYACHVTSLLVAANVSSYSMTSFHEKPHAMNLALYPTMFPSVAWWNYELPFMYRYYILDIILLVPFLLGYFFMAGRFCINDVAAFIILFFILKFRHMFFKTSLILLCLQEIMYVVFPTSQINLYA